jgi:hypothetical protein
VSAPEGQQGQRGHRIVALWSMPRSRSTAFFRMMTERGDFTVLHEPFSYLAEFGSTEVAGRAVRTEPELIGAIRDLARGAPLFFKDTTDERYPGLLADCAFLAEQATHTFLIRHPAETIPSYYALNPRVRQSQIGAEHLHEIYQQVWRLTGAPPLVVDAADLVSQPAGVVRAYCARLSIPYLPDALSWSAGARAEWQPSARWHADASASTGLGTNGTRRYGIDVAAHPVLGRYLDHQLPFYLALREHRLVADDPAAQPSRR